MILILALAACVAVMEWLAVPLIRRAKWAEENELGWRAEQVRRMLGGRE